MEKGSSNRRRSRTTSIMGLVLSLAVLGGVAVAQTTGPRRPRWSGAFRRLARTAGSRRPGRAGRTAGSPGDLGRRPEVPGRPFVVGFEEDGDLISEEVGDDGGETTTFYRDADSDGFGDPGQTIQATSAPAGCVATGTD